MFLVCTYTDTLAHPHTHAHFARTHRNENAVRTADALSATQAARHLRAELELERLAVQAEIKAWTASKASINLANQAYVSVEGPPGFTRSGQAPWTLWGTKERREDRPDRVSDEKTRASSRFKSHDWQVMAETDLGRWLFSFLLTGMYLKAVLLLLRAIRLLCRRSLTPAQRRQLVDDVTKKIAEVRKQFPETEFSILLHGLVHIAEQCVRWGPVWARWMYGFERLNGYLVGLIQDRSNPEASIVKVLMRLMFHRAAAASAFRDPEASDVLDHENEHNAAAMALLGLGINSRRGPPTEGQWRGGTLE
jgi:hypothetical protein